MELDIQEFITLDYLDIIKLLLAILVGGVIGTERKYRDKAAGLRAMIFICVGATLFTIYSIKMGGTSVDRTRIAANIVSGVGFLGAGAIIRDAGRVKGMTTAATVWIVAALGMGIGAGYFMFSVVTILIMLVVLVILHPVESLVGHNRQRYYYRVVCSIDMDKLKTLETMFDESGLQIKSHKRMKREGKLYITWDAVGPPAIHQRVSQILLDDKDVEEVRF